MCYTCPCPYPYISLNFEFEDAFGSAEDREAKEERELSNANASFFVAEHLVPCRFAFRCSRKRESYYYCFMLHLRQSQRNWSLERA
jgi:hypothetical protein